MQRRLLLYYIAFLSTFAGYGQQLPIFTQYREYHSYINPATISNDYISQEYNLKFGVSYRSQWVGLQDAPKSLFFNGEYLIPSKNKGFDLAVGGYLLSRNTDPIKTNGAYGKLTALFTDDPFFGAFAVGFTFGSMQYKVAVDNLNPIDGTDIVLAGGNQQATIPDLGVGVFYYKQLRDRKHKKTSADILGGDVIYAGFSIPQLLAHTTNFNQNGGNFSIEQKRHYFVVAGYYKYLNEVNFIESSIWWKKTANVPNQLNLNMRYQHNNRFWAGTGYSSSKTLHVEAGMFLKKSKWITNNIKFGYGFDYPLGAYRSAFSAAHELNISFFMDTRKKKR